MPRFHVNDTFEIDRANRKIFVLAGSVVEGEIQKGMFLQVPFNSAFTGTARIYCIEVALRRGRGDVCLCFEPEQAEILRNLNIEDETFEITTEGTDWMADA